MPLQNFIARQLPTIKAAWLNQVDVLKFTIFGDSNTKAEARTALGVPNDASSAQLDSQGIDGGAVNAAAVTLIGPIVGYTRNTGSTVSFTGITSNTGAATLNVNGTGVAVILNQQGDQLTGGELSLPVTVVWTGAAWRIIAGAITPALARQRGEILAGVIPVNYLYLPGCVDRYATNDTTLPGTTDMSPAFSAAAQSAGRQGFSVTWGATAPYRLNAPVNCTGIRGVVFEDHSSGSAASGAVSIIVAHTGHAFDCSTSTELIWRGMTFKSLPGIVPNSLFFCARNTLGSGAGFHRFYNIRSASANTFRFIYYGYGSEENDFYDCVWYNNEAGSGIVSHNQNNPSGFSSSFVTIAVGPQSNTTFRHFGCEYLNFGNSGSANETCIALENAANFSFLSGLWLNAHGLAYVAVSGSSASFTFDSIRAEAAGTTATYGIRVITAASTHVFWTLNNVESDAAQQLVSFAANTTMVELAIRVSSNTSGNLLNAYNLQNSIIEHGTSVVISQLGGTVQTSTFIGSRSAITFSGTDTLNTGFDQATGQTWESGDTFASAPTACTGAITAVVTWTLRKFNRRVYVRFPAISAVATAATSFTYGAVLPVQYRPSANIRIPAIIILDAGATRNQIGMVIVDTAGVMTVFFDLVATGVWTAGAGAGLASTAEFSFSL